MFLGWFRKLWVWKWKLETINKNKGEINVRDQNLATKIITLEVLNFNNLLLCQVLSAISKDEYNNEGGVVPGKKAYRSIWLASQ